MFLKSFKNVDKQNEAKCSHEAMHFVVAKCASMFDKQNSKCLPNNVSLFVLDFTENPKFLRCRFSETI